MHEWVETGISAVLLALAIAVFVGFILPPKVKERSARQVEILKLRRLAEEEEEHIGQQSTLEYTSSMLLNTKRICAICLNPAPKVCSRCKAVRYCSQECQHQHWKQGHKYECVPVKVDIRKSSAKISPVAETPGAPVVLPTSEEQKFLPAVESVPAIPEAAAEAPATEIVVAPEEEIAPTESLSPEAAPAPAETPEAAPAPAPGPAPAPAPAPELAPDPTPAPFPPPAPGAAPSPPPAPVLPSASAPPPAEAPVETPVAALPEIAPEASPSEVEELAPQAPPTPADGKLSKPKKILFPYDAFVNFFNWDILRLPPCGLINCGNSCFANVVLQCLTYTRPLTAYLSGGIHGEACRRNDWCFMCELQQHVCRVKQSQNPFSPIRILSRIRNIGNHLGYGRQEDAHEFMRFAIDSMQSICLDEFGGEKAVDPRTQETTLIHHIFGGHLQSQVKCMQCQHESNRYESMMDLAVEIQGFVESLEDALAQFTAPECLDGDNKYKCDRCNAYVQARKRLTIHEAPNVLTIALKRFQSGKFGKLNKRVTFPEVLDISPYMSGKGDSPPAYQLYAVVVHVDMLNASFFGHYICYVKNSLGSWYKIDDSKVKEVDLDKVLAQKAYMLFYSRSNARPAPMVGLDGGYISSSTRASTLLRDGIAVANGHHASGYYNPRVHAFASKVPGVMPAITGTLCVGNGSLQRVGEGHGSSWIQDGGGLVSLDSVSPWTDDVEMVSINADDTTEDAQNPDPGYVDADYRMSVGESNQDRQEELVACCGPPDVSSDQLLQAGKRRLEAGVSLLPLSKGLDDWLPPSANHSRSSSCPSSLHATSDCLLSSSSLTPDVCSGATDSIESEYNLSDIGGNQNGCFPDAGERGEIASDLALEIFQVDLVARAKRQHIECKTNGTQSSVIRKSESSDSTMDMEWAELECEEPDSVSEAKSEAPEPEVPGCDQMERLPEASLGIQGVSSLSACELFPCQGGITQGLSKSNSPHPISSSRAYQDFGGVQHSAKLEGSVSSVADDLTGCLDGVSTVVRTSVHQLASNGTVQDKGLKLEPVITNAGVASSNSSIPRVQTKLKPLISPGFLNRSHGPKGRPKAVASKRKTGEDISVACPEEDSNGPMACVVGNTGKQLSGAALRNDPDNGLLHSRVVENGVSNGPPQKGRVKSMRAGMSGSGRSGGNASGATLVGGEPVPLHFKESSTNQAVKATQNGGKVAASRQKQGRNEICACGSQRKWKKCCGKADVMKVETRRVVV